MSAIQQPPEDSPLHSCTNPDLHPHINDDGIPAFARMNHFAATNVISGSAIYLPFPQENLGKHEAQVWTDQWATLASKSMTSFMQNGDDAYHACDFEIYRSIENVYGIHHNGKRILAAPLLMCVGNPANEWRALSALGFEAITGMQAHHYFDIAGSRNTRDEMPGVGVTSDGGLLEDFMEDMCGSELFKTHGGVYAERIVNKSSFTLQGGGSLINPHTIVIRETWRIGPGVSDAQD